MPLHNRAERLQLPTGCIEFDSAGRLNEGETFRAPLRAGLEFRLHPEGEFGWYICDNPSGDPSANHVSVVPPPYQTAPHLKIGPGYGETASQSAKVQRQRRFTVTEEDYRAALAVVTRRPMNMSELYEMLNTVPAGTLTLTVTGVALRRVVVPPNDAMDALSWVTFEGKACWQQ